MPTIDLMLSLPWETVTGCSEGGEEGGCRTDGGLVFLVAFVALLEADVLT